MEKRTVKRFVWFHVICMVAALIFPFYVKLSRLITLIVPGCAIHDFLKFYCPLCGGTRAVEALLSFDLITALQCNAFVVAILALCAVLYILAWIRLLRGERRLLMMPEWGWVVFLIVMLLFGVLRNVLMIAFEIDPLGDLLLFWN